MTTPKTETEIKREITGALEACGAIVIRVNAGKVRVGSRYIQLGPKKIPDIYAIGKFRKYWVEVKRPGEEPTDGQKEMIQILRDRGEEVVVATSIDDLPLPI